MLAPARSDHELLKNDVVRGRLWSGTAHGCNLFIMTAYTGESAKGCCSPAFS